MRLRIPSSRSATWVLAETATAAAFSLVSMLLIGRVIGPYEAGIGAIAVSALLLLDGVSAALFTDALVQRPQLSQRTLRSALTASVAAAAAASLLLAAASPLLARATGNERLLWLTLALVPLPAILGASRARPPAPSCATSASDCWRCGSCSDSRWRSAPA